MKKRFSIRHKLIRLFKEPIRVFCFHQVSEAFDASTMWECDWTQLSVFKLNIMQLQKQYTFVSIEDAYGMLNTDKVRCGKYAVLTADDGWASIKNVIPWLADQNIPLTMFINPNYLDGKHYQRRDTEKLLTEIDIKELVKKYPHHLTIASHGMTHVDALSLSKEEFANHVAEAERVLSRFSNKVQFYAFTYGHYHPEQLRILYDFDLVPVLVDKELNYKYDGAIHRECIDGQNLVDAC